METCDNPLIKYDLLSVNALDKIHICLDLLSEYGYIEAQPIFKKTYENIIGVYNLERENKEMWKMIWEHKIFSLFQMEKQSGIQGIALTKPESVDELSVLNSVIRLMAQEKGAEQPLNKFARFKKDISLWYDEMDRYGLTEEEQKLLEPIVKLSYGICESQEKFMQLVQMPECGGFNLTWADSLRKSIAKKNPEAFEKLQKEYFEIITEKGLSKNLCNYVWNVLVSTSKGYGFNASHTLAYSLIALQEMNLAFKYPTIFWSSACLISDSGGAESEDTELEENEDGEIISKQYFDEIVDFNKNEDEDDIVDDEEEDDEEEEIISTTKVKKKKKRKSNNYGKIATAIGKMKEVNITVMTPDINRSSFTFSPEADNNLVRYGFSGISRINIELINEIISKRPFTSFEDFLERVHIAKIPCINLIKSGAFDSFGSREDIMKSYITAISEPKKDLNLRNVQMLIRNGIFPMSLEHEMKVFNFNSYLKKFKHKEYYILDDKGYDFYEKNFDIDSIQSIDGISMISQVTWDKIYQKEMDKVRNYIKANKPQLLNDLNNKLFQVMWEKYSKGTISKWEMDSVSYYSHEHELQNIIAPYYDISDFYSLPEQPEIDQIIYINGKSIPLLKINRIAGTVLDKDKSKKIVTLLTTSGVVQVKIFGQIFSHYDKQLSDKDPETGKKKIRERSWLSRGNKIIVTGIRRDDIFIAKKYKKTPYHLVEIIDEVREDGTLIKRGEREG